MLDIIIKGLFIGFLSSAPMGPVGMLCVQRTLNDGRKSGLMTGLGAIVGDIIFAILAFVAALGLGFSTEFLQQHQWSIQIIGSLVLILFGTFVYKKNPSKSINTNIKNTQTSYWKLFMTSLALTLSNVATLLLYIALFARFNIVNDSNPVGYDVAAILFIGVGALLWWLIITYIVNKLRGAFNPRGLKLFNRIIGVILITIGIVGIFTGVTSINVLPSTTISYINTIIGSK